MTSTVLPWRKLALLRDVPRSKGHSKSTICSTTCTTTSGDEPRPITMNELAYEVGITNGRQDLLYIWLFERSRLVLWPELTELVNEDAPTPRFAMSKPEMVQRAVTAIGDQDPKYISPTTSVKIRRYQDRRYFDSDLYLPYVRFIVGLTLNATSNGEMWVGRQIEEAVGTAFE